MRTIRFLALCSATALVAGCQEPTQPSTEHTLPSARAGTVRKFTVTDLGSFIPSAINSAAQVVGSSPVQVNDNETSAHASLWEKGVITDLGTLGGNFSRANAINPAGQVVGGSETTTPGEFHAFLWEKGVMTDLGTLAFGYTEATGINAAGQVVGISLAAPFQTHAFLWEKGVMTDLTPGDVFSVANAISPAGQVVGKAGPHAFLWEKGVLTDLTPGGNSSEAIAINAAGQVVGWAEFAGGQHHAVMWEKGVMMDLSTGSPFTDYSSSASGINASGQVVGTIVVPAGLTLTQAFLWQGGVMTNLDQPPIGVGYGAATGINARGQIVGWNGVGETHGSLWTVK